MSVYPMSSQVSETDAPLTDNDLYTHLRAGALALRDERYQEFSLPYQTNVWRQQLNELVSQ